MSNENTNGDTGESWYSAAGTFFGTLAKAPISLTALASALVVMMTDPVAFVREYIVEGLLVFLVETVIRGFFGLLGQIGAELELVAGQLWNATFGLLADQGSNLVDVVLMPLITGIQATILVGLANLGVAAPLAAAVSLFVTALLVSISVIIVLELLRWAIPIDALLQPVIRVVQGARAAVSSRLPLIGSRGDS